MKDEMNVVNDEIVMRSEKEIGEAEAELFEKVWHEHHLVLLEREGKKKMASGIKAAKRIQKKYPKGLGPYTDFEWGMLCGYFAGIRWVLGSALDDLDT